MNIPYRIPCPVPSPTNPVTREGLLAAISGCVYLVAGGQVSGDDARQWLFGTALPELERLAEERGRRGS